MVSGLFVFPWFDSTMEQALLWLAQTVITPWKLTWTGWSGRWAPSSPQWLPCFVGLASHSFQVPVTASLLPLCWNTNTASEDETLWATFRNYNAVLLLLRVNKSETRLTASVLKQDPNMEKFTCLDHGIYCVIFFLIIIFLLNWQAVYDLRMQKLVFSCTESSHPVTTFIWHTHLKFPVHPVLSYD